MHRKGSFKGTWVMALAGAIVLCGAMQGQEQAPQGTTQGPAAKRQSVPDPQIEANVLKALASAPEVANQNIQSSTTYGVVTLSGSVTDDAARQKADDLVSRVAGVQKVMDQMTVGGEGAQMQTPGEADAQGPPPEQGQAGNYPPPQQGAPPQAGSPYPQTGYPGAPEYPRNAPNGDNGQQGYPPQQAQGYPPQQAQGYPPQGPPQTQPYPAQRGYAPQPSGQPVYGAQRAGDPVTIPPGSLLRVRINEGLSSKHSQPGSTFDGVVLNDVVADGAVAIPRGATVQGSVLDAKASGAVSGRGELTLQLTNVILAGRTFPLNTDTWSRASGDKTVHTVNNALGLGVLGAIIGGVAGGGGGAAIGAAAGAGAGVATSAASPRGQVLIPPEAILTFHTTAPSPVVTVSQAEMDRLAYGMGNAGQPAVRRRVPPPGYYGRPYPY